jgi:outer membrane protein
MDRRTLVVFGLAVVAGLAWIPAAYPQPSGVGVTVTAPAPGQVLTLDEAVALALRQQPTITAAQQSELAAQARIGEAKSAYFPKVDWISAVGRSELFSSSQNKSVQSNATSSQLQANQLLYDFGKTPAVVEQARAGARGVNAVLIQTRQGVVQNVKTGYYNLLQAQRLVRVAQDNLSLTELNLRSAQGFYDVGTKPKSDVTLAEVQVANARVALILARNQVDVAQTTLVNAIGIRTAAPLEVEDILTYEPVTLDFPALLQEALNSRPELRQARSQVESAQAQLQAARAGYLPTLNLTGIYGGSSTDPNLNLFAGSESWSIAGTLNWNLFQGFFTQNQVKETTALVEVARANYTTQELQVRLDVEQAYLTVVAASETVGATDKEVQSAQENLQLAQGRYDAGVGTILDLTTAQVALSSAQADQVRALTAFRVGLATLDRVVGRP